MNGEMINTYLNNNVLDSHGDFKTCKRIICADGTTLSVQASKYHYSSPRETECDFYSCVEVGFPSVAPPATWSSYFDGCWGDDDPCESVYGYIPVELVEEFIEDHGGIPGMVHSE